jgi:hypothetical protein
MVALQSLKDYFKDFKGKDFVYIAIIVVLLICYLRTCSSSAPVPVITPVYKPTEHRVDNNGTSYTQVNGNIVTPEQMKQIVDSLAKALKVKPGNITNVTNLVTNIDTHSYTTNTVYIDTFTHTFGDSISTKDYFLSYYGNYAKRTGSFHLQLSPDTSTYVGITTKRLLRADEYKLKIYHTNKLFEPKEGYSYTTSVPKTIAVLGPFLGLGYNGKIIPVIGIGVTFNLVGIKKKK